MNKARHINCSLDEYHARAEWSRSQLEELRESPPLFYGRHIAHPPLYTHKSSPDFDLGTVAHQCLTSPGAIGAVVAEIPPDVLSKTGGRSGKAWQQWRAEHADKIALKAEELRPIRQMVRNVYAHPVASSLLGTALDYEFTLIYSDSATGLPLKARPDLIVSRGTSVLIVDFKTTRAASLREFSSDMARWGYHRQFAWYIEAVELFGYDVSGAVAITVDKSPAHQCRVIELPAAAIKLGHRQVAELRGDLARRLKEDDWTDRLGVGTLLVDLPSWAYEEDALYDALPLVLQRGGVPMAL